MTIFYLIEIISPYIIYHYLWLFLITFGYWRLFHLMLLLEILDYYKRFHLKLFLSIINYFTLNYFWQS
jgi:hypothetical protein